MATVCIRFVHSLKNLKSLSWAVGLKLFIFTVHMYCRTSYYFLWYFLLHNLTLLTYKYLLYSIIYIIIVGRFFFYIYLRVVYSAMFCFRYFLNHLIVFDFSLIRILYGKLRRKLRIILVLIIVQSVFCYI